MAPRSSSTLGSAAVLACAGGALLQTAFVAPSGAHTQVAPRMSPIAATTAPAASAPGVSAAGAIIGATLGVAATAAAAAGSIRRSRVAAKVSGNQPSLIQVAEQKKLLSTVESLGLLSTAERAGVKIDLVEKLGLLKFAEEKGLLSFAENTLTSPNTPIVMLIAAGALICGVYLDLTESPAIGFGQWVIAGALGVPAAVLLGAAIAIFALFGGTSRTKSLDLVEKVDTYSTSGNPITGSFGQKTNKRAVTLLSVAEEKGLLSFAEEYGLLSLAAGFISNPLTLTEKLRVLSTLERSGLLSTVESSASDKFGAASYGVTGLLYITAAVAAAILVPSFGVLVAALLAILGLGNLAVGLGFAVVQPPRRS
mmetsp:Transcript_52993/g.136884  ORF Transcript_52993/g.136884 Transcript_52993/m.136884 type:complete len:367 (+) Transcript_52993:100-1200(+)